MRVDFRGSIYPCQRQVEKCPRTVLDFLAAWMAGDVESAGLCFADDASYRLHLSPQLLQHGVEGSTREAVVEALCCFRANFDLLLFRPVCLRRTEQGARAQVEFIYRHRLSGETLMGRLRLVFLLRDGLIAGLDEYHDRARVEAFMRLFAPCR